jgi:hypothetical protein
VYSCGLAGASYGSSRVTAIPKLIVVNADRSRRITDDNSAESGLGPKTVFGRIMNEESALVHRHIVRN